MFRAEIHQAPPSQILLPEEFPIRKLPFVNLKYQSFYLGESQLVNYNVMIFVLKTVAYQQQVSTICKKLIHTGMLTTTMYKFVNYKMAI